jgi:peptidoglycan/xylan/chitin deacetylase (PgdA/CDA1 family)
MRNARLPMFAAAVGAAIVIAASTTPTAAQTTTPAPCAGGYVGLRFDDGPFEETSAILDLLKQYHLRATFFVVGSQVQQYPDITRRIIAEGHAIANHTWDHVDLSTLTPAEIDQQLKSTQDIVTQLTGVAPKFAGPPYGGSNATVRQEMAKFGLREVLKSWDSGDWDGAEEWQVFNQLTLVPPGGIILMHDWSPIAQEVIPDISWYFNTYWQSAPICSGRIVASTTVNPVLDWLGQYYFATVTKW